MTEWRTDQTALTDRDIEFGKWIAENIGHELHLMIQNQQDGLGEIKNIAAQLGRIADALEEIDITLDKGE